MTLAKTSCSLLLAFTLMASLWIPTLAPATAGASITLAPAALA